jgi:hypothetical protein
VIGSEQHFCETIGPARAKVLLDCLRTGGEQAREITTSSGFIEGRTEPTVAFDLITGELDGRFDALPGVRKARSNGLILWIVDETYAIRSKKLSGGYMTTNHISGQQAVIDAQLSLDGMPPLVYVTAGARYSRRTGLIDEYAVVKHVTLAKKRVVEWVVDLDALSAGGAIPSIPTLPIAPATAAAALRSKRGVDRGIING